MTDDVVDDTAGAPSDMEVSKPIDWDKAVSAAYLWLTDDNVKGVAEAAGVGERTLHRWVRSKWWPDACREAEARWGRMVVLEARRTLIRALRDGDADLALKLLERRDPDFRPLPQDVRVLGLIRQLPPDEVRRLQGLPVDERKIELRRLLTAGGA